MNMRHYLCVLAGLALAVTTITVELQAQGAGRSSVRRAPRAAKAPAADTTKLTIADTAATPPAEAVPARPAVIRVAFFEGDVTLLDSSGVRPVAIGTLLDSSSVLKLARGASVQISVSGALSAHRKPGKLSVMQAVKATKGRVNEDVESALSYLAQYEHLTIGGSVDVVQIRTAVATLLGIGALSRAVPTEQSAATSVILEPRETSVTRGPLRFRWTSAPDSTTYRVAVFDRHGSEIFRGETSDTTLVWDGATLFAEVDYTWRLTRLDDTTDARDARFRRVDDVKGMRVEGGESRIRSELGSENPALPLLMAAHFARHGLFGDASRHFTAAAERTPEHYRRFMLLAREQYAGGAGLSEPELERAVPPEIAGR